MSTGANDNFGEDSLAGRVTKQARSIAGRREINDRHLSISIADHLQGEFGVGWSQVLVVLEGLPHTPSEIMERDNADLLLKGIGYGIQDFNEKLFSGDFAA